MKKMYIRFIALVMALAMAFSCTLAASAAEVTDSNDAVYTRAAVGNEGTMSLVSHVISEWEGTLSTGQVASGSFHLSTPSVVKCAYVFVNLSNPSSSTAMSLELIRNGSHHDSWVLQADASSHNFYCSWGTNPLPAGNYTWKLKNLSTNVQGKIVFYDIVESN